MNLQDMTCQVEAYDAIETIVDAVEMIFGERNGDGAIDKLMGID